MQEVEAQLRTFTIQRSTFESQMKERWKKQEEVMLSGIERVIKLEEAKVRERLERERKAREEEERKRKEEEERRKAEEQKKKEEEEARKKKEEEEAAEQKRREEEEKERKERLEREKGQRDALGMTTAEQDWMTARTNLLTLKSGAMKQVKSTPELKREWGKWRRQITPKVGQVTNDDAAILRVVSLFFSSF
jgi:nucleoporin GLE1